MGDVRSSKLLSIDETTKKKELNLADFSNEAEAYPLRLLSTERLITLNIFPLDGATDGFGSGNDDGLTGEQVAHGIIHVALGNASGVLRVVVYCTNILHTKFPSLIF